MNRRDFIRHAAGLAVGVAGLDRVLANNKPTHGFSVGPTYTLPFPEADQREVLEIIKRDGLLPTREIYGVRWYVTNMTTGEMTLEAEHQWIRERKP